MDQADPVDGGGGRPVGGRAASPGLTAVFRRSLDNEIRGRVARSTARGLRAEARQVRQASRRLRQGYAPDHD